MSKKSFAGGIDGLFGGSTAAPQSTAAPEMPAAPAKRKRGRPIKNIREITKSSQEGLPENEIRATIIVKMDALEKMKAIAYWDRKKIRDVFGDAVAQYLAAYEKKNGPVQPVPEA
jgi:hypothetical protein